MAMQAQASGANAAANAEDQELALGQFMAISKLEVMIIFSNFKMNFTIKIVPNLVCQWSDSWRY
jgi:hypothetical protein